MEIINERYIGSPKVRSQIRHELARLRAADVSSQLPLREWMTLRDVIRGKERWGIDSRLFRDLVHSAQERFWELGLMFPLLDPGRFFVGKLPDGDRDIGGFYSKKAKGFMYLYRYGWSVALNARKYAIRDSLTTLDMARNYIHDSIHAATFRSYRLVPESDRDFAVAYAQYGYNFRRKDGFSYSSVKMTASAPKQINVNLFMDGVTMLAALYSLAPALETIEADNLNARESWILADLRLETERLPVGKRPRRFHEQVIVPTRKFIHYRASSGAVLWPYFEAMLTGKLRNLCDGIELPESQTFAQAWKRAFLRNNWSRP